MLKQTHEEEFHHGRQEASALTAYLDALQEPLAPLGEAACRDWRQEAESHLLGLIAAHEESGLSHEQAVATAIRVFGDEKRIGKGMAYQIRRQQHRPPYTYLSPVLIPVSLGMCVLCILSLGTAYQSDTTAAVHHTVRLLASALFIVAPIICGWNWNGAFVLGSRKWVRLAMPGVFPLYGFLAGVSYATMFDLRLGIVNATLNLSTLIGIFCFPLLAYGAAMLRKRMQPGRQDHTLA